jgi:uncharacterized protein YyaL (SSP411 family)
MTGDIMATDTHSNFHFSPRPNRAHEIQWREWGEEPFREAALTGKPVLLSLSAVWCHWCHVMDETSYSDEGVISFINEHYIPVRVDNDQRPDINARYNMGGWPTTAFLTAEGEVLAGATYMPPEQMKEVLPQVNVHYRSNREELTAKATELRRRRAAAAGEGSHGQLTTEIFEQVLANIGSNYDPMYGGFGDAPKFPHTDAIDLLLYAHRRRNKDPDVLHMARKTLEMMGRGDVFDHEWGGFFRYATRRDWSDPHYEKMLEDNGNLLRNVLTLYRITGDEAHADIAKRTIDYLEWKLRDTEHGYFYGSQDADEDFYKLSKEGRERAEEPYIDHACYTSWNAMAVSAYLEASWTLDREDLRDGALKALDSLWTRLRDPEGGSMYRFLAQEGEGPEVLGLLGDQAYTARALLDAHEVSGDSTYLDRALELARLLVHRFLDRKDGRPAGFFDTWDETTDVGRLRDRQKSLQDNAVCAEVFMRLGHLLRNDEDLDIAKGTLEAFTGLYQHMGYFAAGYAKQVDLVLNPPPEVNIVGDSKSATELHKAALRLDVPARIVQVLDPGRDAEHLSALSLPPEPAPVAYACAGTMCSAPVTDPSGLLDAVRSMLGAGERVISVPRQGSREP